jgi:hypothetical protein
MDKNNRNAFCECGLHNIITSNVNYFLLYHFAAGLSQFTARPASAAGS